MICRKTVVRRITAFARHFLVSERPKSRARNTVGLPTHAETEPCRFSDTSTDKAGNFEGTGVQPQIDRSRKARTPSAQAAACTGGRPLPAARPPTPTRRPTADAGMLRASPCATRCPTPTQRLCRDAQHPRAGARFPWMPIPTPDGGMLRASPAVGGCPLIRACRREAAPPPAVAGRPVADTALGCARRYRSRNL